MMKRKSWSNEKLLTRLINNKSNRTYWLNISELRKRASLAFFQQCILLTKSNIQKEKIIGIDIISQLSNDKVNKPFSKKVLTELLRMLRVEKDPLILISILYGIGHNNKHLIEDKDIKSVACFSTNKNNNIREGVVFALLGIENTIAINTLTELSKDKCSGIRNWSVFGLGSQIESDTTEIRQALYARIDDKHQETKHEAILGLSIRKDLRIKDTILHELLSESYGTLLLDAVEELQDITFLPILENTLIKSKKEIDINSEWIQKLNDCINNLNS